MKKLSILILAVMLGLLVAPMVAQAQDPTAGYALQAGADRLVNLQNEDGGWGWPLDTASAPNTIGPIGMGLAQAYAYTGDAEHRNALGSAGGLLLAKETNFSPPDGYLAAELDRLFGGDAYSAHLQDKFYGPLATGTYDKDGAGTKYDTSLYLTWLHNRRKSTPNLAAWDLGMGLAGAVAAGVTGPELQSWVAATGNELIGIEAGDPYTVLGLAGALYGLASANASFDPDGGDYASADSLDDLADILAGYQLDNGAFPSLPDNTEPWVQETAYAILALNQVNRTEYIDEMRDAAAYLVEAQLTSGGWECSPTTEPGENNEYTAEALWALATVTPVLWVDAPASTGNDGKVEVSIVLDPGGFEVFGFEFTLTYDPAVLSLADADIEPGDFFDDLDPLDPAAEADYKWIIQRESDKVKVVVTLASPATGIKGAVAQLVRLTFSAASTEECGVSSPVALSDVILTEKHDGDRIQPITVGQPVDITVYKLVPASGVVQLQGRSDWTGATVSLAGGPFSYAGIVTDGDGKWSADVACGTYDVYVDMNAYLDAESKEAEIVSAWERAVKLLGGNANENTPDRIFLDDVVAIANVIGTNNTSPGENLYPDINADGTINILDLVLAGINYTEEGPKAF